MKIQPIPCSSFVKNQNANTSSQWNRCEIEAFKECGKDLPKPSNSWACIAGAIRDLAFATIVGLGLVLLTGAVFGTLPVLLTPCLLVGAAALGIFLISAVAKEILDRHPK
jgi:hypothetical protein